MSKFHERVIIYGAFYFFATLVLGFMFVAAAASGLSDAPNEGTSGAGIVIGLLFIFQTPVVLIQLIYRKMSPNGSADLDLSTLGLLTLFSSFFYGYLIAFLLRKYKKKTKNKT